MRNRACVGACEGAFELMELVLTPPPLSLTTTTTTTTSTSTTTYYYYHYHYHILLLPGSISTTPAGILLLARYTPMDRPQPSSDAYSYDHRVNFVGRIDFGSNAGYLRTPLPISD
ncbi:hypothetical protein M0804_004130 [Polistes exclamans]|nr:hypothetical protein M0804_004130 [Polistes exclamans]